MPSIHGGCCLPAGCCTLKEEEVWPLLVTLPRRTSCVMERPILDPIETPGDLGEEPASEPEGKVPLLSPRSDSGPGDPGWLLAYPVAPGGTPTTVVPLLLLPTCAR